MTTTPLPGWVRRSINRAAHRRAQADERRNRDAAVQRARQLLAAGVAPTTVLMVIAGQLESSA